MIVDYDWVNTVLKGNLGYIQFDPNGNGTDSSVNGRIGFFDIQFNVSKTLLYPWLVLTDIEDGNNGGNYFTYSFSQSGPFTSSLNLDTTSITPGGKVRVYVQVYNSYAENKQVRAHLKLTPGGNWNPPTWNSYLFSYQLIAGETSQLSFNYFDMNGNNISGEGLNQATIGFIDVTLTTQDYFPSASFVISDIESNGDHFLLSYDNNNFFDSLNWNPNVAVNGLMPGTRTFTTRVYLRFISPTNGPARFTDQLNVQGNVAGRSVSAVSAVFGGNTPALSFRYYDSNGNEHADWDINNASIGFIDVTLTTYDSYSGASFNISDIEPGSNGGNFFQMSFDNANFSDSLTWNPNVNTGGGYGTRTQTARVYIRFTDPQTGARRVTDQLNVNGWVGSHPISNVSAVYGANITTQWWLQGATTMAHIEFDIDDSAYFYFNMRTGQATLLLNNDTRSHSNSCSVGGQAWNPGIQGTGHNDYDHYVQGSITVDSAARPGVTRSSNVSAWLANVLGRDQVSIVQQPNAGNDYTVGVYIHDPDDDSWGYVFDLVTQIGP